MLKSSIIVRLQREFIHRYKDAPKEVAFLREYHRHMLHFEVEMGVTDRDRELEFICVKRFINHLFDEGVIPLKYIDTSCENVALDLINSLCIKYGEREITVKVFEDGENGGKVTYVP